MFAYSSKYNWILLILNIIMKLKDIGGAIGDYGKSEEKSNSLIGKKRSADEMTDEEFARLLAEEENQHSTAGTILCQKCTKTFSVDSIYILDECSHK